MWPPHFRFRPALFRPVLAAGLVLALAGCDGDGDEPVGPDRVAGFYVLTSIDGSVGTPLVRYDHTFRDGSRHTLVVVADTIRVFGDTGARRHDIVELRVRQANGTQAAPVRSAEDYPGSATRRGDTLFVTWRPPDRNGAPAPTRADTLVIRSGVLVRNDNVGLVCADAAEQCPVPRRVAFGYTRRGD